MPKLWNATIEAHRAAVRDATLDAAAALVAEHGLTGVTMSRIAEATGIGRATLYKYFPDVDAVLLAGLDRQVSHHLARLTEVRDQAGNPPARLAAVLTAYAAMSRQRHDGDIAAALHQGRHITEAHQRLANLIRDVLDDAAQAGHVRTDVPADELVGYCLHALSAARRLDSEDALRRLVTLTLTALRPPS